MKVGFLESAGFRPVPEKKRGEMNQQQPFRTCRSPPPIEREDEPVSIGKLRLGTTERSVLQVWDFSKAPPDPAVSYKSQGWSWEGQPGRRGASPESDASRKGSLEDERDDVDERRFSLQ
eukprot:scaffold840_cov344-Pavlova_lutheri.AAC.24